jgi:hypothetical protein
LLATAEQAFASHHVKKAAHRIQNLTFNLSEIEAMNAFAKIKSSDFTINNPLNYRDKPEIEWMHKLCTRAHLNYIHDRKLFDVNGRNCSGPRGWVN